MKTVLKIAFAFILILYSVNAYSQNDIPKPEDVILNPNFDKYVGTWKWENNESCFTLILRKILKKITPTGDYKADMLIGYHEYKKDGTVIISSLNLDNLNVDQNKHTIQGGITPNKNELILLITTLENKNGVNAAIEYIDTNHIKIIRYDKLNLPIISSPGHPYREAPTIDYPSNIILTKQ